MKLETAFRYGVRQPRKFLALLVNFPKLVKLHVRLLQDPRVPFLPKALFCAALIYAISPADLIPDFLAPIFGYADDVIVIIAASRFLLGSVPPDVFREHLEALDRA